MKSWVMMTTVNNKRATLKTLAGLAASGLVASRAPYVFARTRHKLRVLGTHVTLQQALRQQAMQDLGIDIEFQIKGGSAALQKASISPASFDVFEHWSDSIGVLWRAGSIQPIEKRRIRMWDEINLLTKTGKMHSAAKLGAGDAPYKIINVQADGSLGSRHSKLVSFVPFVHNADSFGYNMAAIGERTPESWGWLLDEQYSGKVGIVNAPSIGLFDLALAAQARGLMRFADIGAITHGELDKLFGILIDLKQQGHFSGFWTSVPESVDFMRTGRVVIESMFSPAVSALNGQNVPVKFAVPAEGYRGWHGVMCLSAATQGRVKDIAYEYMNWWLSGWPGAYIARQGYYISNPARSARYLEPAEWDYWYQGKPAGKDLTGIDGKVSVRKGQVRSGGSYETRFSNIAVWNTVMPTYEYSLQKWYEFVSS